MKTTGLATCLVALCLQAPTMALADGMVFSEPEVHAKIEIPNQQALIQFADGVEELVIETSFLGEGTNFAWVVPLPPVPEIEPVSENFFPGLQQVFQPRLIHDVHRYYIGVLFVCGLAFLAWRSFKDEVSWINDLPVCALLAAGAWFFGKSWLFGLVVFGFVIYVRIFTRSTANLTLVVLVGMAFSCYFTFLSNSVGFGLIQTMSSDAGEQKQLGVDVVSVQHAGVFDSTTIRSSDARAVIQWLEKNGYNASDVIEPVVSPYVKDGWVFVASKLRRDNADARQTSIHPLAFKFATRVPVYPMKLTAAGKSDCVVDLYVFGDKRAGARHFSVKRCDRVSQNWQPDQASYRNSWLGISDPEVLSRISHSTVGTKLSAQLSPTQMDSDVEIKWNGFWKKGALAYSNSGALTVTLNVVLTLAPLIWISVGACRGGWGVDEKFIWRWRWRLMIGAIVVGIIVFLLLPKVSVIIVQHWPDGD
jgi:ABC-type Fe3+-siderophore transport system permease subunit